MTEITGPTFADLGLSARSLDAIKRCGYLNPTPIQQVALPLLMEGRDVLGAAKTGSGKTGAFLWPMLELLTKKPRVGKKPRALILAPTRELAAQIHLSVLRYRGDSDLRPSLVIGGESATVQRAELKMGCDILVATPGRLIDAVLAHAVDLSEICFIVLDEADRMLEMGFYNDTRKLLRACAPERQSALFSATLHHEVEVLAEHVLTNPVRVEADPPGTLVETISEQEIRVRPRAKPALIHHLLKTRTYDRALVFAKQRARCAQLVAYLASEGFAAEELHGAKAQHERRKTLNNFRNGSCRVLVATDIASRGLDIDDIALVIHADIPEDPLDYVHRAGRSARMGRDGQSVLLVSDEEMPRVAVIAATVGQTPILTEVPDFDFDGVFKPLANIELPSKSGGKTRDKTSCGKAKASEASPGMAKGERARRREKSNKRREAQGSFKVKRTPKRRKG